jgi:N-acetylmuramoyl-L-alanine amidase
MARVTAKAGPFLLLVAGALLHPGLAPAQALSLPAGLEEIGATLQWDPDGEAGYLDLNGRGLGQRGDRIAFSLGSPWMVVNYMEQVHTAGVLREQGELRFPAETVRALRVYFEARARRLSRPRVAAIIVDPGHGGKDPGAIGTHTFGQKKLVLMEKDVVLAVSRKLFQLLQKEYPDKRILLTRQDDRYVQLEERPLIANGVPLQSNEAIIYVSIHANYAFDPKVKGYEVWVLPSDYRRELLDAGSLDEELKAIAPILNALLEEEYSVESTLLAKAVLEGFDASVGALTVDRGVKEESWYVVRKSKMPSILIEMGFLTNREEAQLLADEQYLQKLAAGIYTGIRSFISTYESTQGFTE